MASLRPRPPAASDASLLCGKSNSEKSATCASERTVMPLTECCQRGSVVTLEQLVFNDNSNDAREPRWQT